MISYLSKKVIQDVLIESILNIQNQTQFWGSASNIDNEPRAKYTGMALLIIDNDHTYS